MPLSKEQLGAILSKSRALMTPEVTQHINNIASNKMSDGHFDDYDYSDDATDMTYLSQTPYAADTASGPINKDRIANSKLPEAVKKALMESETLTDTSSSVLESINIKKPSLSEQVNSRRKMEQQVTSGFQAAPSSVDYSIIKAIVSECLNEYFKNNKQAINESGTLETIGLQNGNITLVDNKGNVFTAKLEKIGNKNDF